MRQVVVLPTPPFWLATAMMVVCVMRVGTDSCGLADTDQIPDSVEID